MGGAQGPEVLGGVIFAGGDVVNVRGGLGAALTVFCPRALVVVSLEDPGSD